jgi:S1-C subfamily serine protease
VSGRRGLAAVLLVLSACATSGPSVPREAALFERVAPSVLLIISRGHGSQGAAGTGVIVSRAGLVLTAAHVVVGDDGQVADTVLVALKPSELPRRLRDFTDFVAARVRAVDTTLDVALLEVDVPDILVPIDLDERAPRQGAEIWTMGHPQANTFWVLSHGVVLAETPQGFLTDIVIAEGESGGPVIDERGRLLGVNTKLSWAAASGSARAVAIGARHILRWLQALGVRLESPADHDSLSPRSAR